MTSKILAVLLVFLASCSSKPSEDDCARFRNGTFKVIHKEDGTVGLYTRSGSMQREVDLKTKDTFYGSIKWTGPCEYQLYLHSASANVNDSFASYTKQNAVTVNIIQTNKDYYVFSAKLAGFDTLMVDTMFIVR